MLRVREQTKNRLVLSEDPASLPRHAVAVGATATELTDVALLEVTDQHVRALCTYPPRELVLARPDALQLRARVRTPTGDRLSYMRLTVHGVDILLNVDLPDSPIHAQDLAVRMGRAANLLGFRERRIKGDLVLELRREAPKEGSYRSSDAAWEPLPHGITSIALQNGQRLEDCHSYLSFQHPTMGMRVSQIAIPLRFERGGYVIKSVGIAYRSAGAFLSGALFTFIIGGGLAFITMLLLQFLGASRAQLQIGALGAMALGFVVSMPFAKRDLLPRGRARNSIPMTSILFDGTRFLVQLDGRHARALDLCDIAAIQLDRTDDAVSVVLVSPDGDELLYQQGPNCPREALELGEILAKWLARQIQRPLRRGG